MKWWHWKRAEHALETWVRALIDERPYAIRFAPGKGSYMRFDTQEIVIDPTMVDGWGGERWLPLTWRGRKVAQFTGLQWRVARTMARHEAGHVLFTGDCPAAGGIHHWLTNSLEDERIERLTARQSPAAGADFRTLARLLARYLALPDPKTTHRRDVLLNACLFWRWDARRPAGEPSRLRFASDDDTILWQDTIRPLVEQAWQAADVREVAAIAREILRHIGITDYESLSGHTLIIAGDIHGALSRAAHDLPLDGSEGSDIPSTEADAADDDRADAACCVPASEIPNADSTLDDNEAPELDVDPSAGSLWLRPYDTLAREVSGEVHRLLRVLIAPAPDTAPRRSASSGAFSARAYSRSRGEQPLHIKRDEADDPAGLAICLLIDRTTSMGLPPAIDPRTGEPDAGFFDERQRILHARRAAMLLELTCTRAAIPLAIGYAGDRGVSVHNPPGSSRAFHRPDRPVTWLRTFATPPQAEGPKALIAGLYGDSYSECVSASLREAARLLARRPERTKLILFAHDGSPTDERPETAAATIATVRKRGIIVLGVYLGDQEQISQLEAIFGAPFTIPVAQVSDLPRRLGRILLTYRQRETSR